MKTADSHPLGDIDAIGGLSAFAYASAPQMLKGFTADEKALFDRADEGEPW